MFKAIINAIAANSNQTATQIRILDVRDIRRCTTVELTRRRESKHPSPHQASYETRSRRSRPTICYAAPDCNAQPVFCKQGTGKRGVVVDDRVCLSVSRAARVTDKPRTGLFFFSR